MPDIYELQHIYDHIHVHATHLIVVDQILYGNTIWQVVNWLKQTTIPTLYSMKQL